jgi:hypothetical protein
MKYRPNKLQWLRATAVALMAAGAVSVTQAQPTTNLVIAQFDTSTDPFSQLYIWWGGPVITQAWDGTQNNPTTLGPNHAGSGSLKITADWTAVNTTGGPQPQIMFLNALSGTEWNQSVTASGYYYDLNFDIMFDPASAKTANGDFGHLTAFVTDAGWNRIQVWDSPAFTNSGWTHVHGYIDPAAAGADTITGFCLNWPWQTAGTAGAISGVQTVWLDNIILNTNLTKPLNPPTLTLNPAPPAVPGLNISSSGAAQYDRNSIATVNDQAWLSNPNPVTYSLTIAKYPDTNYTSYQTHIFLVPNPGTEASPDWNEPNLVFLDIENQANGTAIGYFRYKTNEPGGNTMVYGPGTLGSVTNSNGALGTWTMTWQNDTNVTITAPGGATLTTNITADAASLFGSTLVAYFGAQPNSTADIGQKIVLSNVKITGSANPINDSFPGPTLDTNTWVVRASQPNNVFIPSGTDAFIASWTLPDLHFNLQIAPSVTGPWTDLGLTNTSTIGAIKSVAIPKSALPAGNTAYFRMVKPVATKLQVLLPGETAAPNTPTGKTGTPTPATIGAAFNITVNAVDNNWNVVNYATDTITITSSDPQAFIPLDAPLVGGTAVFNITLNTAGSATITATDVTDSTIKASTSSSVTVSP